MSFRADGARSTTRYLASSRISSIQPPVRPAHYGLPDSLGTGRKQTRFAISLLLAWALPGLPEVTRRSGADLGSTTSLPDGTPTHLLDSDRAGRPLAL